MGGAVAAFGGVAVALLAEDVSVAVGEDGAEGMIAAVAGAAGGVKGAAEEGFVVGALRHGDTPLRRH